MIRATYGTKAAKIVELRLSLLKSEDFRNWEGRAGFRFSEVTGPSDRRYTDLARLLADNGRTPWRARSFLYHVLNLNELYKGDGFTRNAKGEIGLREYFVRNQDLNTLRDVQLSDIKDESPSGSVAPFRDPAISALKRGICERISH